MSVSTREMALFSHQPTTLQFKWGGDIGLGELALFHSPQFMASGMDTGGGGLILLWRTGQ